MDDIIGDLLGLITEIFTTKALYRSLNTSTICLIPKGGELVYLTNFKPISILSSVYKIIAKILANRMIPFLPIWIKKFSNSFCARKMHL